MRGMRASMRLFAATISLAAAVLVMGGLFGSAPAAAQNDVPTYTTWQPGWDTHQYDRHHVILGTVSAFVPYRLTVMRRNGDVQTVDLKHGTVIYPTGATPTTGERVALVGYYSNGTFVANRVILRP